MECGEFSPLSTAGVLTPKGRCIWVPETEIPNLRAQELWPGHNRAITAMDYRLDARRYPL